jgi:hypothetical protein
MKKSILLLASSFIVFLFLNCPQTKMDPSTGNGNLPVKTIEWEEDESGFRQYYTNDTAKYNNGSNHLSYYDETMDTIEMQVKKESGSSNYGFGLNFCYNGYQNRYIILIDTNGHYAILRKLKGATSFNFNDGLGWVVNNKNWPYNQYLKKGFGALNDIKVVRSVNTFHVSFNGTEVFSFTDGSFTGGEAGCTLDIGNSNYENFPNTPEDVRYKMISTKKINSIYWMDDGKGFTQFYTNDSQYYNRGDAHTLGTVYSPMKSVETEIKKMSGNESYGYGIVYCYQDGNNFYQLLLTINGYYRIDKKINGIWNYYIDNNWTASTTDIRWPHSDYLNTGYGSVNRIKITRNVTGTFTLFFNGVQITTFDDVSLSSGQTGFCSGIGSQAAEGFPGCPVDIRYNQIKAE